MLQWGNWITSPGKQYGTAEQEYFRLLQSVPAKLREYLKRHKREYGPFVSALNLPKIPAGAPRKDALANEAAQLKKAGKSYAEIARYWNHKHGLKRDDKEFATGESIRKLIKRREQAPASPPDKTPK